MKTVKGNLISLAFDGEFDIIIHGCNCQCRMRNGIAKEMHERCPSAEEADWATITGDPTKLGTYSQAMVYRQKPGQAYFHVVNAYTQEFWGTDARKVSYDAVRDVFQKLGDDIRKSSGRPLGDVQFRVGYCKIGCGLAGGDWSIIHPLIQEGLKGLDITYVEFDGS